MTSLNSEFYDLTQNTQGVILGAALKVRNATQPAPEPPPVILQLRSGLAESPGWMMVQALEFDPEPITVEKLRVRAVWSAPGILRGILELLMTEKWLDRNEKHEYCLTAAGRDFISGRRERLIGLANLIEPLPAEEIAQLAVLTRRVIEASLQSSDPPGTWCLRYSHRRAPAANASDLVKVFYAGTDFNAFRDDCHMAAFRQHNVEAYVWETFSLVWNGTFNTPEAVYDQQAYRGFSQGEYRGAFEELVKRSWLVKNGDIYQVTVAGQTIRQAAEILTDQYFYAPWSVLDDHECAALVEGFQKLHDRCMAMSHE